MKNIKQKLLAIIPSIIIIIIAYLIFNKTTQLSSTQLALLQYAPFVVLFISGAIALRFNRNNMLFLIVILLTCLLLKLHIKDLGIDKYHIKSMEQILSILIPLNIIVFSLLRDRGILSLWGMMRIFFLLIEGGFVFWIIKPQQTLLLKQILQDFLPIPLKTDLLPHLTIVIFVFAFFILIARFIMLPGIQNTPYLGALTALLILLLHPTTTGYSIFLTATGIIFMFSILQDSYFMAFYDELTKLPSRRALKQDMMKLGMRYSIAMLDIDFFKKFNDTYGHDTGDEVLRLVASVIKDVKNGGKAYRYGGEEFTILFPGRNVEDVFQTLDELRERVAQRGFTVRTRSKSSTGTKRKNDRRSSGKTRSNRKSNATGTKRVEINISIGVAERNDVNKQTDQVMKAADKALYRAKKKGRNCVCK